MRYVRALDPAGRSWGAAIDLYGPVDYMGEISMLVVNGKPAVAYHESTFTEEFDTLGSLYYMQAEDADGLNWGDAVLVDDGMGDNHGGNPFLAIVNGMPAISYKCEDVDSFDKGLFFVQASDADGSSWNAPVQVQGPVSGGHGVYDAPLAVIDGFPAILFQSGSPAQVSYVRATDADGTAWGTPQSLFATTPAGYDLYLAEQDGLPALVYDTNNSDNSIWRVGTNATGGPWGDEVVIYNSSFEDGDPGAVPQGLVFVDGVPMVLVDQYNDNRIVFCRADDSTGTSWGAPEHVTFTQEFSGMSKLKLVGGKPSFVYVSGGQLNFSQLQ